MSSTVTTLDAQPRPTAWPRWWWDRLELSPNTHRSFAHGRPTWRGRMHRAAALLFPLLVARLVLVAPDGRSRLAALLFGLSMEVMLATSAVVHLRRWGVWTTEVLFRADHTAIFVAIAGTGTPVALLALDGWARSTLLVAVWGLAVAGMAVVWHPRATPEGFGNTAFISLGGVITLFSPLAVATAGTGFAVLLAAGGAVYTVGAVLVALQRPDPLPGVFGYHEVWHVMVLLGLAIHLVMVETTLLPLAG